MRVNQLGRGADQAAWFVRGGKRLGCAGGGSGCRMLDLGLPGGAPFLQLKGRYLGSVPPRHAVARISRFRVGVGLGRVCFFCTARGCDEAAMRLRRGCDVVARWQARGGVSKAEQKVASGGRG